MIKYEKFEKYMLSLKDFYEKSECLDGALQALSKDFGGFHVEELPMFYIELLEDLMDDKYENISYYIYETNWGTNGFCPYDEDDNPIPFKELRDVYNFIEKENNNV